MRGPASRPQIAPLLSQALQRYGTRRRGHFGGLRQPGECLFIPKPEPAQYYRRVLVLQQQ